jgi:hypothetical protein
MRNFFDLNKRTQKAWGSFHVNALDTEEVLPRLTAVRQVDGKSIWKLWEYVKLFLCTKMTLDDKLS